MKNWKLILTIGFFSLVSISCGKDDEIGFPVILHPSEVVNVSNIRMFTNKEEIYDTEKINQFIHHSNMYLLKVPDESDLKDPTAIIHFFTKDSVSFGSETFVFEVEKKGRQFLFYSPPSVIVDYEYSEPISLRMLKYPPINCGVLPHPIGRYLAKEVRVGYGDYQSFDLCFLLYQISDYTGVSNSLMYGRTLNEFNTDVISTLGPKDTLAIREYRVRFKVNP